MTLGTITSEGVGRTVSAAIGILHFLTQPATNRTIAPHLITARTLANQQSVGPWLPFPLLEPARLIPIAIYCRSPRPHMSRLNILRHHVISVSFHVSGLFLKYKAVRYCTRKKKLSGTISHRSSVQCRPRLMSESRAVSLLGSLHGFSSPLSVRALLPYPLFRFHDKLFCAAWALPSFLSAVSITCHILAKQVRAHQSSWWGSQPCEAEA